MLNGLQKIQYFTESLFRYFESRQCPVCGEKETRVIDRKYIVTRLLECANCHFRFRHPYESDQSNKKFYQLEYQEKDGITTDMPYDTQLKELIESDFLKYNDKNAERLIKLFQTLFETTVNIKIIDYGCSWGYISYQFKKAGMNVQSFEISKRRGEYGNQKLDLNIVSNAEKLKSGVDIFFSSHVIEHVASVNEMIATAKNLVRPGGYFIALCPNGSEELRKAEPISFHLAWGKVHPNFISEDFLHHIFKGYPMYLQSTPINYSGIEEWNQNENFTGILSGIELLCIVKL